ncbi:hypothetical protein Adt_14545 [Abeliophyllum distichum]|uniref:Uncharacterized protein n=1 Tax=Abeliophyllum distichum TaxID=126358 RepID=A0ABD1U0P2_9LAMI
MAGVRWLGVSICGFAIHSEWKCLCTCSRLFTSRGSYRRRKARMRSLGGYYFCPWGSHKPLVTESPSFVKQWKESWFWMTGKWQRIDDDSEPDLDVPSVYGIANVVPRCELYREIVEVLWSIYQAPPSTRRYGFILNRHRDLIELGLMTMDKEKRPRPALARLNKQKSRALAVGSSEEARQKKVLEDMSWEENKEVVEASKVIEVDDSSALEGDVPLSRKKKSRSSGTGALQESVEIVDNYATCSASPLQRTLAVNTSGEAVKNYFTPKWEEFSSHGELEDVLEASLASAIRASTMQMKILGESQDSNVLNLTKQLDNANAAQKVAAEALEVANQENRHLLDEVQNLRENLESSENGKKEAKSEVARLMGEKKEMEEKLGKVEAKLENAEAEFVVNFCNTEAYTNFMDYFARVGQ